jgi:anaerobic magnesium-protoporphyrin IX monomethyl ester cyclase
MNKNKVILFNPRSAKWKHRLPLSVLQVGASIMGKYDYVFVDGNMEEDPWQKISTLLGTGDFKYFGCTVMPGPQLKQAIPISKKIREYFPEIKIIWGGYFASNQYETVLQSGFVDFVIYGPGDVAFPALLDAIDQNNPWNSIPNLVFLNQNELVKTKVEYPDQNAIPSLPYEVLNSYYPVKNYLVRTFLGTKTTGFHSSIGCPFTCSFCAIPNVYNSCWKAMTAEKVANEILWLKNHYGVDAVEFNDNNFFTSRERVMQFSELIKNENITWWGEGRIDTLSKYSDEDLHLMKEAGCKMIFLGAETGSDKVLKQMNKGGTQTGEQIKEFTSRLKKIGIIPEYSFVLGLPGESPKEVMSQIDADIRFIKEIKRLNPDAEIIIYLYSPVPSEGTELYTQITEAGFYFPEKLEDWLNPVWENFDLRKNPLTPWLTPKMVNKIRDFETVLNGYFPTQSDIRINGTKKALLRSISWWRYKTGFYRKPYEIKVLQRILKYRQPEIEGFYAE